MKIVLFANTDWYLYNFRISLARRLRRDGHDVLLLSSPGAYGPLLRDMGFRWQPVAMNRRSLNPFAEAKLILSLALLFRREVPDLVHGLTIKCAVYGSLAARLAGISARVNAVNGLGYVFTSDDTLARFLRPIVRGLMKAAFGGQRARLVVQNPDDRVLFLRSRLIPEDRIRLIPGSGVDMTIFFAGEHARAPEEPLLVLLPARLLWDKGVQEFVDAATVLKKKNMRFMIAGDIDPGNPAAVPMETALAWQAAGLVELLGHVGDMAALYRSVDVVVLPSYREGLPKALIEAAACALPIVTTDVPGCREVVTNGVDGLIVPVRNATALAEAITRLESEPGLAARLGAAARKKALAMFDEKIIVARTLEVYAEIL